MAWEPEKYTREQRYAAAKTVIHGQGLIYRQDRSEFGKEHAEAVRKAYMRADDLLSMLMEAMYVDDLLRDYPPAPPEPSAS